MQALRGELMRARETIVELMRQPTKTPAERLALITMAAGLVARLQQATMDAHARLIERGGK